MKEQHKIFRMHYSLQAVIAENMQTEKFQFLKIINFINQSIHYTQTINKQIFSFGSYIKSFIQIQVICYNYLKFALLICILIQIFLLY